MVPWLRKTTSWALAAAVLAASAAPSAAQEFAAGARGVPAIPASAVGSAAAATTPLTLAPALSLSPAPMIGAPAALVLAAPSAAGQAAALPALPAAAAPTAAKAPASSKVRAARPAALAQAKALSAGAETILDGRSAAPSIEDAVEIGPRRPDAQRRKDGKRVDGMVQYFYASPDSKLPVRDVANKQGAGFKTEPHVETGAENFIKACVQANMRFAVENGVKYLFLVTRNVNKEMKEYFGRQFVVGYIRIQRKLEQTAADGKRFVSILGKTKIVSYEQAVPVKDFPAFKGEHLSRPLINSRGKLDPAQTNNLLRRLEKGKDVSKDFIAEVVRLDPQGATWHRDEIVRGRTSGAGAASRTDGYSAMARLLDKVSAVHKTGGRPVVLFDLDDTLLDARPRSERILREFIARADVRKSHASDAAKIEAVLKATGMPDYADIVEIARAAGATNGRFLDGLKEYWTDKFFANDYVSADPANPGAVDYVKEAVRRGATVVYFTARWNELRPGTLASLKKNGFPRPDGRRALLMMKRKGQDSAVYKREKLEVIAKLGEVVGGFDNEPVHINDFKARFGDAEMIFLDTRTLKVKDPKTGRLISVAPGIPRVKDFRWTDRPATASSGKSDPDQIHPERTAMARNQPSVPTRLAKPLLKGSILDFGAGRGEDTRYLKAAGLKVRAYDPFYAPDKPTKPESFDWVMFNYVLNVIRKPEDRAAALRDIAGLLKPGGRLLVSVRGDAEIEASRSKDWTRDGDGWITPRQTFQHGYTQKELEARLGEAGFKVVKVLSPLIVVAEKTSAPQSPKRRTSFGKQTPQAVYFHRSLDGRAPPRLDALVKRARKLLPKNARWNLIKVDNHGEAVSFLSYPDFDTIPHPALRYVYRIDLKTGTMTVTDHSERANPFILHRKETMVGPDYRLYAEFSAVTAKEEAAGLLSRNDIGTQNGWDAALKAAKAKRP
ncbi:MAG: methyltransferase domain-containing protein [Elusimicrobiota bacterium]